jgi:hypothetical protein
MHSAAGNELLARLKKLDKKSPPHAVQAAPAAQPARQAAGVTTSWKLSLPWWSRAVNKEEEPLRTDEMGPANPPVAAPDLDTLTERAFEEASDAAPSSQQEQSRSHGALEFVCVPPVPGVHFMSLFCLQPRPLFPGSIVILDPSSVSRANSLSLEFRRPRRQSQNAARA